MQFDSWIEAKLFVEANHKTMGRLAQEYFMQACEEFCKEMLGDEELLMHGWSETEAGDRDKTRKEGSAAATARLDLRGRGPNFKFNHEGGGPLRDSDGGPPRRVSCFVCGGEKHRARQCPSSNIANKKEGNRCQRCGGVGNWATACPSQSAERGDRSRVKFEDKPRRQGNGKA